MSGVRVIRVGERSVVTAQTTNAANANPAAVTFTRIDTPAQPHRFVSGITVDPNDAYHAWVSFSGYSAYDPGGHVFEVHVNPNTLVATWTDISHDLGDIPVTGIARRPDGRPVRLDRLQRARAGGRRDELDAVGSWSAAGGDLRPDHLLVGPHPLRGDPRERHLESEPRKVSSSS